MSRRLMGRLLCLVLLVAATFTFPVLGQQPFEWPEKPKNLQVLPQEWSGERLRPVMRGFSASLGVRCSHCHAGPSDAPLSEIDFASDENPKKEIARTMLRMLGGINDTLATLPPNREKVNMWCHTCHRGRPLPMTLIEELDLVYDKGGADSLVIHYSRLRDSFYGRGSYDFGENSLNQVGYGLLEKKDVQAALLVFELNVRHFPTSPNAFDSLAEACEAAGLKPRAIENYKKVLELDPGNRNAAERLQALKSR